MFNDTRRLCSFCCRVVPRAGEVIYFYLYLSYQASELPRAGV